MTYLRVDGEWRYLYRAVDGTGQTIDFLLSAKRDKQAAKRFFRKALGRDNTRNPREIVTDRLKSYIYPFRDKTLLGERKRKVDYVIEARLWLRNNIIVRHEDISDIRAWARMAFGYPKCLIAGTTFFHDKVKQEASRRLEDFVRKQPAYGGSA